LKIAQAVEQDKLTLVQVAFRFATPRGDFVGKPEQIADAFELWLHGRSYDGFVLGEAPPPTLGRLARIIHRTGYSGLANVA